jgi:hypothetical protein
VVKQSLGDGTEQTTTATAMNGSSQTRLIVDSDCIYFVNNAAEDDKYEPENQLLRRRPALSVVNFKRHHNVNVGLLVLSSSL